MQDSEHFFGIDLKLPEPEEAVNSLAHKSKFVLENVMLAGFGKNMQRTASGVGGPGSAAAAAAAAASAAATGGERTEDAQADETFHMLMEAWRSMMAGALDGKNAGSRRTSGAVEPGHGQHAGVLQSPLLGRLMMRKCVACWLGCCAAAVCALLPCCACGGSRGHAVQHVICTCHGCCQLWMHGQGHAGLLGSTGACWPPWQYKGMLAS
jgi:hypothetical protein